MDTSSLTDFTSFINQQIKGQEQIEASLWKLEALIAIATNVEEFYEVSPEILHNYFSIAGDLVEEATKANQININNLWKHVDRL